MRPIVAAFTIVPLVALLSVACNDNGTTNNVSTGTDCGLIRDDLLGAWSVALATTASTLQDCTGADLTREGDGVSTADFPATYGAADVFANQGSTSFSFVADRSDSADDANVDDELNGSVQADSCLGIVRVWSTSDDLFFQCIGTFFRSNRTLSGSCDSVEIDSDHNGSLDTACSLSVHIPFDSSIQ